VSLDWNCGELEDGLACYRSGKFFLAHEHWESVWLKLEEPEKTFLQTLIQVAAAFHHLDTGNSIGALSLLRRALRRLEHFPQHFGGIDLPLLRGEVTEWMLAIERGTSSLPAAHPHVLPLRRN
jgi:hypothetical protein